MPKADAKILYRAVPRKGQVAVYMEHLFPFGIIIESKKNVGLSQTLN
jgi:hypothetical protein